MREIVSPAGVEIIKESVCIFTVTDSGSALAYLGPSMYSFVLSAHEPVMEGDWKWSEEKNKMDNRYFIRIGMKFTVALYKYPDVAVYP